MPLPDLFAAFRWWVVLLILGASATPLAFRLLGRLPDRGYAFVKMLGLLGVSYLFWIAGSLGFVANDGGGLLLALVALIVASAVVAVRHWGLLRAWLRDSTRYILAVELLFALLFFGWVWVRAQNPAIMATEKPMEFAFLNAAGRSPIFPPLDPWLSGYAISYYYFGYVMISVIARVALVAEPLAFNLGVAWLVAGSGIGAFGLVYNLVAARLPLNTEKGHELGTPSVNRRALALGVVAALALPLAGNLQILMEMLHAHGIGSPGFWGWLNVRDISGPAEATGFGPTGPRFWWWWRASRVIREYDLAGVDQAGLEPIAEFPGFSFILGDMHPHVLALPFAFLSLAVALLWWLKPMAMPEQGRGIRNHIRSLLHEIGLPLLLLTALVLGGLSFLNTWDVLIHLFVVVGAFVLAQWRRAGGWRNSFLLQGTLLAALLVVPAVLLYLPFYLGFRSQAGAPYLLPMLMQPTRLPHFLIIFGMPLWSILILVGSLLLRRRRRPWKAGLAAAGGLIGGLLLLMFLLGWIVASSPEGAARIADLAASLDIALPALAGEASVGERMLFGLRGTLLLAPALLAARLSAPWLVLLLAALAGAVVMLWIMILRPQPTAEAATPAEGEQTRADAALPFVLLLVLTAALLTVGPEFVYLRDNFGVRLNTIFKFYYQSWVLFGVAALFALDYLWRQAQVRSVLRFSAGLATAGYGLLLVVALLFPVYGVASRAAEYAGPPTLDGLAFIRQSAPDEYAALLWLRDNVAGTPVIAEAVGGQYSEYGRVAASTGLPTILGWAGHEYQWRGATPEPALREPAVAAIYGDRSWEEARAALNRYGVEYIYVGPREVATYGPQALTKFADALEVAFASGDVVIYRWLPE